ncbi:serine/threonine-protein kinase pakD [Microplitis demolitor]|uniref:serine/threonine-protein kinase pakD n=1 Tax=Microplitis demolitor TaxID=69319 RepID=UPI0004CD32BA|nr:serine/threonine-protein kinase pakD [Microplitis demolitor]
MSNISPSQLMINGDNDIVVAGNYQEFHVVDTNRLDISEIGVASDLGAVVEGVTSTSTSSVVVVDYHNHPELHSTPSSTSSSSSSSSSSCSSSSSSTSLLSLTDPNILTHSAVVNCSAGGSANNNNNNNSNSSSSSSNSNNNNNNSNNNSSSAATAAYNMVAAMNEHLSSSSATNSARTTSAQNEFIITSGHAVTDNVDDVVGDKPSSAGILTFPCDFDHMYASMTDGGTPAVAATATSALGVSPLRGNEPRLNDLAEVKHLKELLLLHLDLIQQQSEQIVTKDKLLAALRQENETLKLRLERMDRRVNLQKLRSESTENSIASDITGPCSPPSLHTVSIVTPLIVNEQHHKNLAPECNNSPQYNESFKIRLNTSGGITTVKQEHTNDNLNKLEVKPDIGGAGGGDARLEWESKRNKRKSDPTPLQSTGSKRKRGVSCSSTISNDTTSTIPDTKNSAHDSSNRKSDKKGKSIIKKESFLTTEEHYYTALGDPHYNLRTKPKLEDESNNLEVPSWRIKVYTSCYTMEGTENLDDEIFNKRHLKLENDERRRKRWDVQRIREQRHIEKLKQRQERQNHQATCYNTNHTGPCPSTAEEEVITTLWPDMDQIQSLQVDPELPVSAFGAPVPSFTPSEFSLPWLHSARSKSRRPKRSTSRRKSRR